MTELFNNREIAIAFWATVFFGLAISQKEIRHSIFQVLDSFFSKKIIIPFMLLVLYVFFDVLILSKIHIWSLSNLKETIYWFIFSGAITVFLTIVNDKVGRPIRTIVKELITVTIVLEFIVNAYVFGLIVELVLFPILAFLTALYTYASLKAEYKKVELILGTILAIIVMAMLTQALIMIYHDFDKFGRFDTFIDFILPPILMISILPAIYLLMMYALYDSLFIRVDIALENDSNRRRYAKMLLIINCYFRVGKLRKMLNRVNRLYDGASKEDIRKILISE